VRKKYFFVRLLSLSKATTTLFRLVLISYGLGTHDGINLGLVLRVIVSFHDEEYEYELSYS